MNPFDPKRFMSKQELAYRWHISVRTLEHWMTQEKTPPYHYIGKFVRFWIDDVTAFEQARRHESIIAYEKQQELKEENND